MAAYPDIEDLMDTMFACIRQSLAGLQQQDTSARTKNGDLIRGLVERHGPEALPVLAMLLAESTAVGHLNLARFTDKSAEQNLAEYEKALREGTNFHVMVAREFPDQNP